MKEQIRKAMMPPFRIYNETTDELDGHLELVVGLPFKVYHEVLNEGEILHWLDFIGNDKNGIPVFANDTVVIKGRRYKAIYCEEYDGALLWQEVVTDKTFFYNDAFFIDVQLLEQFDLGNAELYLGEDENEEEYEEDEDFKSGYGIPLFKVVNIVDKCEIQEEYLGQCYDELIENVMYFRKCVNSGTAEAYEMDVIKFFHEEFGDVHAVILPYLPLSPFLIDTVGGFFWISLEELDYENLGNYYLLEEDLRAEIAAMLLEHHNVTIYYK